MNKRERKKQIKRKLYKLYTEQGPGKALVLGNNFAITIHNPFFEHENMFGNNVVIEQHITLRADVHKIVQFNGGDIFGRGY